MLYLSGCVRPEFRHPNLGFMLGPNQGNKIPPDRLWAADNGAFSTATPFSWDRFEHWLMQKLEIAGEQCLFVVCPDVPFDAGATLERWKKYHSRMTQFNRPVAFVTQDGMTIEDIPWSDFETLFIGGATEWAPPTRIRSGPGSGPFVSEARRRGKWVHFGRVNSLRRLRAVASMGGDSADGTFLKYGPDKNWPRLHHWLDSLETQPSLLLPHP
ncbi:hypothetical protein [uncultured Mediterranean phage uvDeep-CGR2-KM24-C26]|nr:hypothetical protein [uncultured Mediterranean phage uvDeep-CGR2-KM24-C26]